MLLLEPRINKPKVGETIRISSVPLKEIRSSIILEIENDNIIIKSFSKWTPEWLFSLNCYEELDYLKTLFRGYRYNLTTIS